MSFYHGKKNYIKELFDTSLPKNIMKLTIPSDQDITATNFYKSLIEGEKCRIINNEYAIWYLGGLKSQSTETQSVELDFEIEEYQKDISMAIDTIRKAQESIVYIKRRNDDDWYGTL